MRAKTTMVNGINIIMTMKRSTIILGVIFSLLTVASLVSCEKEKKMTFGVQMEQPTDPEGSKTYLGHGEEWMYWEDGDSMMCKIKDVDVPQGFHLVSGHRQLTAVFETNDDATVGEDKNTKPVLAIYPYRSYGSLDVDHLSGTINLLANQEYRQGSSATNPDSSFGRAAMPMVAYEANGLKNGLYFHVVAGMLRIELFSSTNETISEITFTEVSDTPKQISGPFTINGINTYRPYLTATAASGANLSVKISNINQQLGSEKLFHFYLPLPAVDSSNAYTRYNLKMVVKTTSGKYYTKKLVADIHRRNITFLRAVNISKWENVESGGTTTGLTDVHLVGEGSKDRPFEIYSSAELAMVRDAFNSAASSKAVPVINGLTVTEDSYFQISRSDIKLTTENWNSGIKNFTGHMYFASNQAVYAGITNESNVPIFASIGDHGVVERLNVKGTHNYGGSGAFSPFCGENNGTIIDCHNQCAVTALYGQNLAGICVTNNGTIRGGANEANLISTALGGGNVAGVCLTNSGTIQGNFTLSSALPKGNNVAGICYTNNGTVKDCQLSANAYQLNATGNWGGIVFDNLGMIDNSVSSGTVIFTTTGSIGGIANSNSGTIKNCSNRINRIEGKSGSTGGICGTMTGGKIYNCFSAASATVVGYQRATSVSAEYGGNAGGIVGMLTGGNVVNCYNRSTVSNATNAGGIVGVISFGYVANCYNGNSKNFCGGTMRDVALSAHLLANCFNLAPETGCVQFTTAGTATSPVVTVAQMLETLNGWVSSNSSSYDNGLHTWEIVGSATYPSLTNQAPRPFTPYTDHPGTKKKRR